MQTQILLVSIKPEYAYRIFSNEKTVELRKIRPRLSSGDYVLVYISAPEKLLAGYFEVEKVIEDCPEKLWEEIGDDTGLKFEDFNNYFENSSLGFGICLRKAILFQNPVDLESLRKEMPDFRPPQGYLYLKPNQIDIIEAMTDCKIASFAKQLGLMSA